MSCSYWARHIEKFGGIYQTEPDDIISKSTRNFWPIFNRMWFALSAVTAVHYYQQRTANKATSVILIYQTGLMLMQVAGGPF